MRAEVTKSSGVMAPPVSESAGALFLYMNYAAASGRFFLFEGRIVRGKHGRSPLSRGVLCYFLAQEIRFFINEFVGEDGSIDVSSLWFSVVL